MDAKTPWRDGLYQKLEQVRLKGSVIDLGGSRTSGYHELFGTNCTIEVANIDEHYAYDHFVDLEKPFPFEDGQFDNALCINTLEHIYHFRELLQETYRTVKQGGMLVLAVPFLVQIHACPHDYWRFTGETLERALTEAGWKDVRVVPVGSGPGAVLAQLLYNPLRFNMVRALVGALLVGIDAFLGSLSRTYRLRAKEYPLGFMVTAVRNHGL